MKELAISIRQPWASLIVNGLKTIEIRSWKTNYRGKLLVHASRTIDDAAARTFHMNNIPTGVIIGSVILVRIEEFTPESWYSLADNHLDAGRFPQGFYGWFFENQIVFDEPISYKGQRGLFQVELSQ